MDESLDPKLAYFGFARCLANNENDSANADLILQASEYTAPEYTDTVHGHVSTKADVFSFGMLILKTISGCRKYNDIPTANENFVHYAWTNWWAGTSSSIVDPRIDADSRSIRSCIHIGLLCVQEDASDRPTMEDVLAMLLSSSFLTLPIPRKPVSAPVAEPGNSQTIKEDLAITNVPVASVALLLENQDIQTAEEFILELHAR
ncbi:kinase-like domain-containing protein [Tanacetum coccineum]